VLFGVVLVSAAGAPLPATLLLIAAGAIVDDGRFSYTWAVIIALVAAVAGDNLAYGVSRWGGRKLARRLEQWAGGEERIAQARRATERWGGAGVFLSRWLLTPLGPAINVTSGLTNYPWAKFVLFDIAGEALWVGIYTTIGRMFSDRVQQIGSLAGNITWAIFGMAVVGALGAYLFRQWNSAQDHSMSSQ
jgi:membrane-associated protein